MDVVIYCVRRIRFSVPEFCILYLYSVPEFCCKLSLKKELIAIYYYLAYATEKDFTICCINIYLSFNFFRSRAAPRMEKRD